jgi:hypothetical protein
MRALSGFPDCKIVGVDRRSGDNPNTIIADLSMYDSCWARCFDDADSVLHLAGETNPVGGWAAVAPLNIDLALNVLRAAEERQVRRFVFASSNWVLGGYRFGREPLTTDLVPRPLNPYGASKLFIERCGFALAERTGMSFLALRIGYCQAGENRPGPQMALGRWGQEMWLSNGDWERAVICAVTSSFSGSAAINVVSNNVGMRWSLDEGRRTIGYFPQDHWEPLLRPLGRLKDIAARARERIVPQGKPTPAFGTSW